MTRPDPLPYRVVDAHDQGWYLTGTAGALHYSADYSHRRDLEPHTYEALAAGRGPLRPVEPVTDDDAKAIQDALTAAGAKAAGSLTVALYRLFRARTPNWAGQGEAGLARLETSERQILAGREGSWESAGLAALAWEVGSRIAEKPNRYDAAAVQVIVETVDRWVTDPARYTEVAETLAHLFGEVADAAGGWAHVADRYLQPKTRWEQVGTDRLYGYLMSTAGSFDPSLL